MPNSDTPGHCIPAKQWQIACVGRPCQETEATEVNATSEGHPLTDPAMVVGRKHDPQPRPLIFPPSSTCMTDKV